MCHRTRVVEVLALKVPISGQKAREKKMGCPKGEKEGTGWTPKLALNEG